MRSNSPDPAQFDDAELSEACARGDARAWREMVRRYRRLVYGIPLAMGLQPADADEVFQRTFAQLVRHLPALRDASRLEAWLVTTSRRAALRLLREERRRSRLAQAGPAADWAARPAPDPAATVERLRDGERVRRAVESLGHPCDRLLIGLFATPSRPYREIARELGLAVGSLGATRARCLRRLRLRLTRGRGEGSPPSPLDRSEAR